MKAKIISGENETHGFTNGSIVEIDPTPDEFNQFIAIGVHQHTEKQIKQWLIQEEFEVIPE